LLCCIFENHNQIFTNSAKALGERLLKIERFRAIFREQNKKIYYDIAAKEDVDLMHHAREVDGKGIFGENELIEKICSATVNCWDPNKSLWDVTLITNLKDDESRSVLLCRIDHAIGDGVALTGVLQSLLDDAPTKITALQRRRATKPAMRMSHLIVSFFTGCCQGLIGWLLVGYDPDNGLKLPMEIAMSSKLATSQGKIFTRAKSFPLNDLKAMKNKLSHGFSINDLLLAVLKVSVRQYLETTHDLVLQTLKEEKKTLHANFLMNTRHTSKFQKHVTDLTNDFIVVSYPFPLNYEFILDAAWRCKSIVDEYKISPVSFLMKHVTCKLLSLLPESLLVFASIDNNLKPTCFISNVIGPSYKSSMAGYTITDLDFLVSANISLYFGIVSYQNKVKIITADKRTNVNVGTKCYSQRHRHFGAFCRPCGFHWYICIHLDIVLVICLMEYFLSLLNFFTSNMLVCCF